MENVSREIQLRNLLRLEVAKKSEASCLSFAMFSLFAFFYHFGCVQNAFLIKTLSLILLVVAGLRYALTIKVVRNKLVSPQDWTYTILLVWLNAVGWSIIINVASFELQLSGIHFIIVTTLLAGLIAASIVTLSYFSILFIPFQMLLLLPQIGIILYYYYFSPLHLNFLPLIFLYLMFFFYQIRQFKDFKNDNINRFTYQIDLEIANKGLKESKEEIIDQTIKLVHVSRLAALGEMAAGIAHEINNPLTIIKGGAQIIEKMIERSTLDETSILKHSQKISRSISRITAIIKGLQNFSYFSDDRPKERATLQAIIEDTSNFYSELLASNNIKLQIEVIPDCEITCHPVQISQVLINLIKNAQDVILESTADTEMRWIGIGFLVEEKSVQIKVSNSGERIPEEIASKIFEPFFSTKPVGSGTGLGLSISQKIMKDHEGELILDQNESHTTFVIIHPYTC